MTEAQSIAADLRADGQEMILRRQTKGNFDPVLGRDTYPVSQQWTVYGITKNYGTQARLASQGLIQSGDKQAILEATVKPEINDTLTIMGVTWRVVACDDLSPQGETLLYTCQLRR